MTRKLLIPGFAAALLVAGTASAQTADTTTVQAPPAADSAHAAPKPAAPRRARPRMNVLTREEIEETHAADMYVLIERLRASWLNAT
ncbi:MAG TPA: hypothetical protein VFH27_02875, partial [Longimicrobiaceae bacterium]|nr:hypothetical protein [Longimicrobiaceae bacterium]